MFCILEEERRQTDIFNNTHAFSGSITQSPSHSHPLGGMKYCCFNFSLPVTSENLWRPTSPVVPHFPNTLAWFSYCNEKEDVFRFRWRFDWIVNIHNINTYQGQQHHRFKIYFWNIFLQCLNITQKWDSCLLCSFVCFNLPAQQTHWRFPQRKSWTFFHVQTDPATCWL